MYPYALFNTEILLSGEICQSYNEATQTKSFTHLGYELFHVRDTEYRNTT